MREYVFRISHSSHLPAEDGRSGMFKRVIATDEDDFCVAEIVDGKFIFPPEWGQFNEEV